MPEYPYVYGADSTRPVAPGGTRLRIARRRPRREPEKEGQDPGKEGGEDSAWRELLEEAVAELNQAFRDRHVPFLCSLDEDPTGFCLHVRRTDAVGGEDAAEELIDPAELPQWLSRLRTRLGLLVDETA